MEPSGSSNSHALQRFPRFGEFPPELRLQVYEEYVKAPKIVYVGAFRSPYYHVQLTLCSPPDVREFRDAYDPYPHTMEIECYDECNRIRVTPKTAKVHFQRDFFRFYCIASHRVFCQCFLKRNPISRIIITSGHFWEQFENIHYDSYCNELYVEVCRCYNVDDDDDSGDCQVHHWSECFTNPAQRDNTALVPDISRFIEHPRTACSSGCRCHISSYVKTKFKNIIDAWRLTIDRSLIGPRNDDLFAQGARPVLRLERRRLRVPDRL